MICNRFPDCLKNLKPTYTDCPCKDENQCRKCVASYDSRRYMVCQERNSRYLLDKENATIESVCYHVDGGVIDEKEHVQRCDYAFYLKDPDKQLILIELKGSDSSHALDQLSAMMEWDQIRKAIQTGAVGKLYGRIVCTRAVPQIYQNKQKTLQARFVRCGGNLKVSNRNLEESYSELRSPKH